MFADEHVDDSFAAKPDAQNDRPGGHFMHLTDDGRIPPGRVRSHRVDKEARVPGSDQGVQDLALHFCTSLRSMALSPFAAFS